MAIRIQLRRDTAANWASANPVLLAGELGVETDTLKIKIGNGSNWNSITSYANTTPENLVSTLSDYVLVADMGQPDGVATLDSTGKIPVAQLGHLIDSAPGVLDTLNEIAAAINDDENFATTMTTLINNTGTTAATDATNKANDAVTTAAAYTDNEIDVLHSVLTGEISTHNSDTTSVHGILDTAELATKTYANAAVSTHNAATTNIHGIADTAELATITHVDNVVSTHDSSTTGIHGIADTAELATKTYANSAASAVQAQLANYAAKAGATFTGDVTIPDLNVTNVIIDGDLTVNGTTTTVSSQNLEVEDPLIYIGTGNTANSKDLGIVGHFDNGTYQHTGIVRDASDGKWKVFSGVTTEPSDTIDFATYTKDTLVVGALEATSATIGNVSNTELQYLDGVTSAIQTQIDAKQPKVSGVSDTEIGYLDGVTSAIQTQIDAKSPLSNPTFTGTVTVSSSGIAFTDGTQTKQGIPSITPIISKTESYTLSSLSERDSMIEVDSSSPVTITIPTNTAVAFPIGASLDVMGINTGLITIAGDTGVTVNATPGLKLRTQWSSATLFKRGTDSWVVYGDLKA